MGNLFLYNDSVVGYVTKGGWVIMRDLLAVLLKTINQSMGENWAAGTLRNVTVSPQGAHPSTIPAPHQAPPPGGVFEFQRIFLDWSSEQDEIYILDRDEFRRIFAWCDFLAQRDGAFALFEPLITSLRVRTEEIESVPEQPGDPPL